MEVFLYNSTVCRLCSEENDSGNLLYSCEENNQTLCELINSYLPIKVSDDGILPRTICPGCTIQLEATVEFINLIINGQKVIRELHQREKEYKKTILNADEPEVITEKIIYEINTSNGVYQVEHPITLQVAGLEKPRRKRGRPPKKTKTPEELAEEAAARDRELQAKKQTSEEDSSGKRRRKAPTRFKEAVQGKELERIFIEEGVIDDESEADVKPDTEAVEKPAPSEPEVIGHMEHSGELVVVVKGKGRGRPKGRVRQTREECAICGMEFSCVGRYMSHIAQHGAVIYQCAVCGHSSSTLIEHQTHQKDAGHKGQNVIACKNEPETRSEASVEVASPAGPVDPLEPDAGPAGHSMPLLNDDSLATTASDTQGDTVSETPSEPVEAIEAVTVGPKGKVRLPCTHCDKTFNSKQAKSLHIKAVHNGEKPYECTECGVKFAYPRSLALHAISHRRHRANNKRYACDLCGKVLNHPSSVVYHKEAEHAGRAWVCNQCGKSFKHRQLLQRHQLVHSQERPHSCKICDATFKTKANLLNHQLLHSGVKKFACDICKHKFAHKTSLTLHMRWHTGSKPFGCKTCGKCFSQKGNLSEHERIHTGEKPYQCNICARKFTTSSQFRLHARRHQPEKLYTCSHCPKRFASRASWLAHVRRTAAGAGGAGAGGQPPRVHTCSVCSRAFNERWALRKHMRKHTGERPFACPHCPRAFADCSNLNKHKKHVHKQISLLTREPVALAAPPSPATTTQDSELALTIAEGSEGVNVNGLEGVTVNGLDGVHVAQGVGVDLASAADSDGEGVIYVTYDVDGPGTAFTIMEPDQADSLEEEPAVPVVSRCSVFGGPSLLVPQDLQTSLPLDQMDLEPLAVLHSDPDTTSFAESIAVTDEQGNPLHFTMQDGTRLAITSSDGKSLQVITQDGQTIPVEINEYNEDEEADESPDTEVHQINLQKAISVEPDAAPASTPVPLTHFFSIV